MFSFSPGGCPSLRLTSKFIFIWCLNIFREKIYFLKLNDCIWVYFFFLLFRAAPMAYGDSQARGRSCSCWPTPETQQRCDCDLHHSSRKCRILNPLSEARGQTCDLMVPSRICVRCTTMGTPWVYFWIKKYFCTFPNVAQWVKDLTFLCEGADLILGFAQ